MQLCVYIAQHHHCIISSCGVTHALAESRMYLLSEREYHFLFIDPTTSDKREEMERKREKDERGRKRKKVQKEKRVCVCVRERRGGDIVRPHK